METISLDLNPLRRHAKPLLALIALVILTACFNFVQPSSAATSHALGCPSLQGHLAPTEASKATLLQNIPISPTLTRYAMVLAAAEAAATPTLPPASFTPVLSEPAPKLGQAQASATACGYPGQVRAVAVSTPVSALDDAAAFQVEIATPKMHGSSAIGIGAAFDRVGDLHLVYVSGTVDDSDGSDPFSSYSEDKPAHPLQHPTGFLILVSVGPYCTKHPRVCGYDHPRGALISIYRGTHEVAHGVTNSKGIVEIVVPGPGSYRIKSSFVDRGHHYTGNEAGFPARAGVMMPVTLTACAPGDFC